MLDVTLLTIFYYSFYLLFLVLGFLVWRIMKTKKISIEIIFLLFLVLIIIWARFVEPRVIKIKNYDFNTAINTEEKVEIKKLKTVVISDLHLGAFQNKRIMKKLVKKINKLNPDVVLISGDFVYHIDKNKLSSSFSELQDIKVPKLAVLGNHDYGRGDNNISNEIITALESNGVLIVDNSIKTMSINNSIIKFSGLEDFWTGSPDYEILNKNDFKNEIDLNILLAHNPDIVYQIENLNEDYKEIDLIVSGHTHAGQMRVPFLYKHIIPSAYNFDRGFYNISGLNVFVSSGIGMVVLPMRLFNFPEISVININY
jgi:hypothetical protein